MYKGRGVSYRKIGLTTMAVTQDLHSGMPLVLIINKNSSALGTVYYLDMDNTVPNYPNSYTPLHARRSCMQWAGGKGYLISLR